MVIPVSCSFVPANSTGVLFVRDGGGVTVGATGGVVSRVMV
jgi:hypothetical protein